MILSTSEQKQFAAIVAALIPISSLDEVLEFVVDEHEPGVYRSGGVTIEAIDSAQYPGCCLDAMIFDGRRVEVEALDAFYDAAVTRLRNYPPSPMFDCAPAPASDSDWGPEFSDLFFED